ncbi:tetratricopeptide repeat-containing glycosyltransferase family 2 protein [Paenibacillus macquariensis]|uniref:Glycosyltransferase involved in cell wall bisynthesis n=1 Tax=Paenibacillus macquariensis TaxID=948756 RepID=A0ABY1KBJ3_9BACL|nr:glycosyltransferase [Paenibacillus macquariensis]MEC0094298.1 glycosyltransferase [Paenibacillus macquariensis]OAB25910.1 glycosyl transferase [Paenibacillus macquariensis subsp. macquariensis]SIR55846.1 Glycosyltransferase involved in cell wall bisynthesis [Paenibacillus macquariensis]
MITISLCLIVKNEEKTLDRCLSSVSNLVDEIIIVDTGSTDLTKTVARKYTEKLYDFKWIQDFAAARNYAFAQATKDYILWLDADDVVKEEDAIRFKVLKETLDPSVDSVTMKYLLGFDSFGNVTSSNRRNRLVKRSNHFRWIGAVHEYLEVSGNIFNSDVAVTHSSIHHDSDRNLNIYEQRLSKGEQFSPRDLYYFANELLDHRMYERAITFYEKFLDTKEGWIEDNISACGKLSDCYNGLNNKQKELESALRSFQYDSPRAEFCCRIGYHFLHKGQINNAIYWYDTATKLEPASNNLGFQNLSCSTWLPHLQLCVCYDRIGNYQLAYEHNEEARKYRSDDPSILQNKTYLEAILCKTEEAPPGESL